MFQKNLLLIEEVKKYEFIYNNAHPDHGKRPPTLDTWSAIAGAVGYTVQQCKSRWQSYRRKYESEYLRMTDSVGAGYESDWKYLDAMSFLQGYVGSTQHFLERLSKMSKRDLFCRACMCPVQTTDSKKECNSYNIFDTGDFADKLMQCTNLQSVPWDEYPHSVCEECYEKVLNFRQFQVMCHESLKKFKTMMDIGNKLATDMETSHEQSLEECSPSPAFLDETTEDHNEIICENDAKQEICNIDPLAEPTDMEDSLEFEKCMEVIEKQIIRRRKNDIKKTRIAETPHIEMAEDSNGQNKIVALQDDSLEVAECSTVLKNRTSRRRKTEITETSKAENPQVKIVEIGRQENNAVSGQEDSLEFERCNDVMEKINTRQSKKEMKKSNNGEKSQSETVENAYDLKIESVDISDISTFEDSTDDEAFIQDGSDESPFKNKSKLNLKCDMCPQTFRFHHRLEAHQRRHRGLPGYICTFENCERAYNRLDELRNHLNDHNGIPNVYKCTFDNCNMVYKCFSGLNKHKRKFHKCGKKLKTYPCETCGKVLTSPRSLTGHRFIHLDKSQWPFVCEEEDCSRKFRLMSQLRIHKRRHAGIKNYICPHCGVRKTTCTELKIHINFHTFEQKFPCEYCSKVFKSVGMKRTHINRVHEGKKPANDKLFECRFCERILTTQQSRKYHEWTHTGEKPYRCEECGKSFTYPSGLASHKNLHAKGENPYSCDQCDRKFKWPTGLKTHMKLHKEGAKPYTCKECGKGFRWPGSYYKHRKTHKEDKGQNEDNTLKGEILNVEEVIMEPSRTEYEITFLESNI